MVKQAKANGQKFTCDGCHKDLDNYELTKNATDDFKKLEAVSKVKSASRPVSRRPSAMKTITEFSRHRSAGRRPDSSGPSYRELAQKAIQYAAQHQRPDASWYYGEKDDLHWVDSFHTAYVLDCFKHYTQSSGDERYVPNMLKGYEYWKNNFFLSDGTPRYYTHKTLPIDIQCSSQAIDTLVFFQSYDSEALPLALKVAEWTLDHMQDRSGYFYYRRYSSMLVNKTPTLHWGQATMLCALAGLYQSL